MLDLSKSFEELKKKEQKKIEDGVYVKDTSFIEFKPNNSYHFRMLFIAPDGAKRSHPFIYQCKHSVYDSSTSTYADVICPVSKYWLDQRGYDKCPICKTAGAAYHAYKKSNLPSDKELYDKARRKQNGYAYVYVVHDSFNPDNEGTIKIMHMGWSVYTELMLKIFGVDVKKNKIAGNNPIGQEAFSITEGYNLEITTIEKPVEDKIYNDYNIDFSRKATDLSSSITTQLMEDSMKELDMDGRFFKFVEFEELHQFHQTYFLNDGDDGDDEINISFEKESAPVMNVKPSITPTTAVKETPVDDDDDILADLDLDDLDELIGTD